MRLWAKCGLASFALVASTPSLACAPEWIEFNPGSYRLGKGDLRIIDYEIDRWRNARDRRVLLSTGRDKLAQRRIIAIKAALMRRGVPAKAISVEMDESNSRAVTLDVVAPPTKPATACG